jgi:demethylmenaquinone methyltransferase/2-methoxy-6-polyprenyl-1,4-benzoquinol methylase
MSSGNSTTPEGWGAGELANPHQNAHKADKVRGMFSSIARSYDLNNRVHSLWRDQAWRRFAVREGDVRPGSRILDVACGTGDLTHAFASTRASCVVGADFTPAMLDVAREKLKKESEPARSKVNYVEADAMDLPFDDQEFDVVSIAFGIRNVTDPAKALGEFHRVLKSGGRLVILEFGQPKSRLLGWFNNLYCRRIMPTTATMISGDRTGAYRYLPASVGSFLSREAMVGEIRAAGFSAIRVTPLTLGICLCYRAISR